MSSEEKEFFRSSMLIRPLRLVAISIGSIACKRLNQERIGQVHSVFRRVFNVLTPENRLICVVRRDVQRGPINVVTNLPQWISMTSIGVRENYEVLKVGGSITVENDVLVISTRNAKEWKPQKEFQADLLTAEQIRDNLRLVKEAACSHGSFSGLGQLIECLGDRRSARLVRGALNPFARKALPHISKLMKAIREGCSPNIRTSAKRLIGLGLGLTPSADDMLSGLMTSLAVMTKNLGINANLASRANKEIASCVPGRTTLISQEFLTLAADGEASEPILELIERIMTGRPEKAEKAAMGVLAIGDPSGTDVMLGILLGSNLALNEAIHRAKPFKILPLL